MTELNPRARALIRAGRGALRPNASDRERIESALRERLGAAAFTPEPSTTVYKTVGWQPVMGLVLSVCVLGTVIFLALRPAVKQPASVARPTPTVTQPPAPMADPPSELPSPAPPPMPAKTLQTAEPVSTPPLRDGLAREVALLSRATTALRAGNAAAALKTLDEHQRQFPRGALSEERSAAKAQALCSLGRNDEGRVELSHLAPHSPAAQVARQLCDAPPSTQTR
jgi:hypothetical protein